MAAPNVKASSLIRHRRPSRLGPSEILAGLPTYSNQQRVSAVRGDGELVQTRNCCGIVVLGGARYQAGECALVVQEVGQAGTTDSRPARMHR